MIKKVVTCFCMIGVVALALASSGGGKKKSSASLPSAFVPVRSGNGITLRAGPKYTGGQILSSHQNKNFVLYKSVITYEKGNVVYILPYQHKVKMMCKTNLNAIDLKFQLRK